MLILSHDHTTHRHTLRTYIHTHAAEIFTLNFIQAITPEEESNAADMSAPRALLFEEDSKLDSVYIRPPTGQKSIKFNASDITKLCYNSKVVQFTN